MSFSTVNKETINKYEILNTLTNDSQNMLPQIIVLPPT